MALSKLNNNTQPLVYLDGSGGHAMYSRVIPNTIPLASGAGGSGISTTNLAPQMSAPSVADVATGGAFLANTAYNVSIAGGNDFMVGKPSSSGTRTTANDASNTHVLRVTIPQQTSATLYDIFASTDAQPKWVGRVTEAQRLAGCTITAVGTVSATSPGAGLVDVQVVGTGTANNVAPFTSTGFFPYGSLTDPITIPTGSTSFIIFANYVPGTWLTGTPAVSITFTLLASFTGIVGQFPIAGSALSLLGSTTAAPHSLRNVITLNQANSVQVGISAITLTAATGTFNWSYEII